MSGRKLGPLEWLGIALVVAIALLAVFGSLSLASDGGYYGMMGNGTWGWAVGMMAIPAVVLVAVLVAALKGLRDPSGSAADPLRILDGRYARGELDRDEYMRMRSDLVGRSSSP